MEKIKFGVEINEDLKRRFKLEAVQRGMSLKDLFTQVLEEWLEAQNSALGREGTTGRGGKRE
jgi:hypothetical protein